VRDLKRRTAMAEEIAKPKGPDLTKGIAQASLPEDSMLVGHVGEEDVLLVRSNADIFALSAHCTHYHGPLADGLVVDGTVRCPWHHACFDLRSGEALRAPAFEPLTCWKVEQQDGRIFVRERLPKPKPNFRNTRNAPGKIVIAGGGAAGFAAAEMLRRLDYQGEVIMLSDDADPPVDRPNLSKDYLAGRAPEEWVPLRPDAYYAENGIDLRLGVRIGAVNPRAREVVLTDGGTISYDRLLLATGAEPVRLALPGAAPSDVFTLRSLADSRRIIARAQTATRVLVVGASFIGLEVAASLRARGQEVHVVAPEERPMERVLGPQLGDLIRALHEEKGVIFHMGNTVTAFEAGRATLKNGTSLEADFAALGVGVRPRIQLAEAAGLALDRGVAANSYLQTSAPDIYAAGDIVRWPDRHSGAAIRVEHWVVAARQGQTAARNMLGLGEEFTSAPFFWSQHYDVSINYIGHAESWDELAVEGDLLARDGLVRFRRGGSTLAVASLFRDLDSLKAEAAMEKSSIR
jgi:NADPH-dependent 2,4-dienoyl-CoA reductase/sulfur reductase-like enzyme/nitrite reductase/ring-hydroxylating ferredoxin subunit